jgi:PAS domain S-box-containing protein
MREQSLHSLLEGTADAVFTVDGQGFIRFWNAAAEKLLGYSAADALNRSCADVLRGQTSGDQCVCGDSCAVIWCAQNRKPVPNYDMKVRTAAGGWIWVNISLLVSRELQSPERILIAHIIRDISSQKEAEALSERFLRLAEEVCSLAQTAQALPPVSPLSDQERRVLSLLSSGKSAGTVAAELGISLRTIRNHLHHINQKLRTHSLLGAVIEASRRRLF